MTGLADVNGFKICIEDLWYVHNNVLRNDDVPDQNMEWISIIPYNWYNFLY